MAPGPTHSTRRTRTSVPSAGDAAPVGLILIGPPWGCDASTSCAPTSGSLTHPGRGLRRLVDHGIMSKVPYQEHPRFYDYRLTDAGHRMSRCWVALVRWSEQHPRRRADHGPGARRAEPSSSRPSGCRTCATTFGPWDRSPVCSGTAGDPRDRQCGRRAAHRWAQLVVRRIVETVLPTDWCTSAAWAYLAGDGIEQIALVLGDLRAPSSCGCTASASPVTCSKPSLRRGQQLHETFRRIAAEGRGVVVYLGPRGPGIPAWATTAAPTPPGRRPRHFDVNFRSGCPSTPATSPSGRPSWPTSAPSGCSS